MNTTLLKQVLIRHEGYRTTVYKDSLGLPTCGIGHLILARDNLTVGATVTDAQVEKWYEADAARSALIARQFVPTLDSLDDTRQIVLVSLAFNMGTRLGGFHNTLAAIAAQEWSAAATELQNSKWYTQVGRRGPELCAALKTGKIGFL